MTDDDIDALIVEAVGGISGYPTRQRSERAIARAGIAAERKRLIDIVTKAYVAAPREDAARQIMLAIKEGAE